MRFTEPVMRPPQESQSLLLRATQGCTYNECHFCYVSRGYRFMAVTLEELEEELQSRKPFFPSNTRIYMTGANPFALPTAKLMGYIVLIRRYFPDFARISMQTRIDDITRKSIAELQELRDAGITHLYTGVENGNDDTLALINKGHNSADTVEQLLRLDDAGITYTTFYVLGLGGHGKGQICGLATAEMLNKVHPQRITTTGLTIFPNTPLADMVKTGVFKEATEREKIEELYTFLDNLNIDVFYDGIHYLNPLNYRFDNKDTRKKQAALADIKEILNEYSDEELEKMVNREMMKSL